MPKGPRGERRPVDAVSRAVMVGRIATGEESEKIALLSGSGQTGKAGGEARALSLVKAQRSEIARVAATKRWKEERRRVMNIDPCNALAERIEAKKGNGLIDIKFYLSKHDDIGVLEVCADLQKFFDAIDAGRIKKLDFGDLKLRMKDN